MENEQMGLINKCLIGLFGKKPDGKIGFFENFKGNTSIKHVIGFWSAFWLIVMSSYGIFVGAKNNLPFIMLIGCSALLTTFIVAIIIASKEGLIDFLTKTKDSPMIKRVIEKIKI